MAAKRSSSSIKNVLVNDETESELPSSSKRFPVDSENPFQSAFYGSDVVLIVEGKKIYADKKTLSLHSPVFQAMFDGDFAEKDAEEIEIKDTEYNAMVRFLRQMYPVKSFNMDKEVLADILPLADFYQVDHFRLKCENYIGQQIKRSGSLSPANKMFFLLMCDRFSLIHFQTLLDVASKLRIEEIKNEHFESLQSNTKLNLLERRCIVTEEVCDRKITQMTGVELELNKYRSIKGKLCRQCETKLENKLRAGDDDDSPEEYAVIYTPYYPSASSHP